MIKKVLIIFFILILSVFIFLVFKFSQKHTNSKMIFGASFSTEYAEYLGLDPTVVFRAILDDYHFKTVRFGVRWDKVEKSRGQYDFSEADYYLKEIKLRNAKAVLAIGQKTPRWPECNVPNWAEDLNDADYFVALNDFVAAAAEHFKDNQALEIWQVENEPFLKFGAACRTHTESTLADLINTVKKTDKIHPVMVTDSGELSWWRKTANVGDIFGTTAYRVVWNKMTGYLYYDFIPAGYYYWRAVWQGREIKSAFIAELQAEPWMPDMPLKVENIDEQMKSMNLERLEAHIQFAKDTGFSRAYFWGVEWWYWLEQHGHPEISDFIRRFMSGY